MIEIEKKMNEIIELNKDNIIKWRRHFHQFPELSFEEFDTSEFIADELRKMGYEVKTNIGGTGVIAGLFTGKDGPTIAFRADMDALPILEETGVSFESQNIGIMHACGHDGHMAVLLGTAKLISEIKDHLTGNIKFIFQPGEEANGGAKCVINDGALKNPDVESIFALHMMPDLPAGTIGIKPGYLSSTDDEFIIKIYGRGAHSSEPETGVNAITIAGQVISSLQSLLSSTISPYDIATFSICKITGGEAINVIPDYVEMRGMIRCVEKQNKIVMRNKMVSIVKGISEGMGGKSEVEFVEGFPSVNNDEYLTKMVMDVAGKSLKSKNDIIVIGRPHLGSEDFAYYQEEIPGVMFMLGCGNENIANSALHSSTFIMEEDSLIHGVRIFGNIALKKCGAKFK